MIVTILAITGVGVLGLSVKVYREEKRKKEFPWTVAAERMGAYPLVAPKPENRFITTGKVVFSKLKEQQKRFFSPETGKLELEVLSSAPDEGEISVEEKEVNRLLALSGGLLVIRTAKEFIP